MPPIPVKLGRQRLDVGQNPAGTYCRIHRDYRGILRLTLDWLTHGDHVQHGVRIGLGQAVRLMRPLRPIVGSVASAASATVRPGVHVPMREAKREGFAST